MNLQKKEKKSISNTMIQIVISSPGPVENETERINELFNAGMELFHLRKPHASKKEVEKLLEAIPEHYRPRTVLHQYHELAERFGISRLHFPENLRLSTKESELNTLYSAGYYLSTSIHKASALAGLPPCFGYVLFGPVFSSISKRGYRPDKNNVNFQELAKKPIKTIAIGGVKASKINKIQELGFDGFALLGSIWNVPREEGLQNLKECISN